MGALVWLGHVATCGARPQLGGAAMGVLAWLSEHTSARAWPPGLVVPGHEGRRVAAARACRHQEEALSEKQILWEGDEEKVEKKRKKKRVLWSFHFFYNEKFLWQMGH